MLNPKKITDIVFIDIETTSQYPSLDEAPEKYQELFKHKFTKEHDAVQASFANSAAAIMVGPGEIWESVYNRYCPTSAEFGRIVCISCGIINAENKIKVRSFSDQNEKQLLLNFGEGMKEVLANPQRYSMCAHSGMDFDFPFITKRLIINHCTRPDYFNVYGKKPWDMSYLLDTKIMWKFNVYNGGMNVSLDLLCYTFGLPSSKFDMHGSMVKDVFWVDKDINRIVQYCEEDIIALARVYLAMNGVYAEVSAL